MISLVRNSFACGSAIDQDLFYFRLKRHLCSSTVQHTMSFGVVPGELVSYRCTVLVSRKFEPPVCLELSLLRAGRTTHTILQTSQPSSPRSHGVRQGCEEGFRPSNPGLEGGGLESGLLKMRIEGGGSLMS